MQPVSAFLSGSTVANAGNTCIGYWVTLSYEQWDVEIYKFRKLNFCQNQILLCVGLSFCRAQR